MTARKATPSVPSYVLNIYISQDIYFPSYPFVYHYIANGWYRDHFEVTLCVPVTIESPTSSGCIIFQTNISPIKDNWRHTDFIWLKLKYPCAFISFLEINGGIFTTLISIDHSLRVSLGRDIASSLAMLCWRHYFPTATKGQSIIFRRRLFPSRNVSLASGALFSGKITVIRVIPHTSILLCFPFSFFFFAVHGKRNTGSTGGSVLPRTLVKSSSFFFASFSRCWEGSVSCWRTICVLDNASRLYEEECNISSPCGHTERSPLCILLLHAPSMFLLHFSSSRAGGGREGLAVTVEQKISCLIPYFFQATLHMLGGTTRCRVIFTRPFIEFVFPFFSCSSVFWR